MKHRTIQISRPLKRTCLAVAASTAIVLSHTGCNGLGLFKKDAPDDAAALAGDDSPKKKHGSLFDRVKRNNSWIDEDIQTTRRDRFAAQNNTTFGTTDAPAAESAPSNLPPEPNADPAIPAAAAAPAPSAPADPPLRLPSIADDLPDAEDAEDPAAEETANKPSLQDSLSNKSDDDGYTPLQPKLPGAESIEPPTD